MGSLFLPVSTPCFFLFFPSSEPFPSSSLFPHLYNSPVSTLNHEHCDRPELLVLKERAYLWIMSSSPRFFAGDARRRHHFLDSCFLCKKRIPNNEDIFMYRGDAPFCSMECRREQMDMDEALENERILCSASYSPASASAQPAPMKRKPTLISIPATCDEKNRYRPDTAAIVAR